MVEILCINIKLQNLTLWESDPLQTVYPNQLNRLKKVGKVHRLKSQAHVFCRSFPNGMAGTI